MVFIIFYYKYVFEKTLAKQIVIYFGNGFLHCNHDPVAEYQFQKFQTNGNYCP